jgi:hypothetical protein
MQFRGEKFEAAHGLGLAQAQGFGDPPAQDAFAVRGIVRPQHGGLARQMEVP